MKKKILAMAFAACLVFGTAAALPNNFFTDSTSIVASADDLQWGDYNYYVLDDGTVEITTYNGESSTVNIPKTINNKKVTSIGREAFKSCSSIYNVTIPDTVTNIGYDAFCYCIKLQSITIPSSVKTISDDAFYGCDSLTKAVIKDGVPLISDGMFQNCTALTSVTIGNSVKSIGNSAFNGCSSLGQVTIPSSVATIGSSAFYDCISLTTAKIGSGVTTVGTSAFKNCKSLSSLTIGSKVANLEYEAFCYCISLTSVTVPSSVKNIGGDVFYGCTSLTNAVISDGVQNIGEQMFYNCTALSQVTIGNTVKTIGDGAFDKCSALTSVSIPDSVDSIGSSAFYDCKLLKTAKIGNGVTTIGNSAFKNCVSLSNLTIGSRVNTLSYEAFCYCTALKTVNLPSSLNTIGVDSFYGCTSLENVNIAYGVKFINDNAFYKCTSLTSVVLPGSLNTIGDEAFEECSGLKSVYILDGSVTIGSSAFYKCENLSYVYIGSTVVTIESSAFAGCNLKSVILPKSIVNIGNEAFGYVDWEPVSGFKIYGYNQHAKNYATNNGFSFVDVNSCSHSNYKTLKINPTRANKGYTLHMCTRCGHTYKDNYTVLDLTIKTQPKNVTVSKAGAKATFTVSASGTGLKYEWYVKDPKGSWTKTGATTNKYSVSVTAARNGRQVFCKVIDASKKYVKSNTVTAKIANTLKITTQPKNVTVSKAGNTATFSVTASGTGLKYEWYIKDVGGNWTKVGSTSNKYSVAIKQERNGRQVFCKVIDKSGKFVKSNIVNAHIAGTVVIISQPSNVTVSGTGKTASFSVKAAGTNMKYEWYIKDRNGSWTKTGSTTNKYSVSITKARNGRQVFCKVIDKSGKYAKSRIVTAKIK